MRRLPDIFLDALYPPRVACVLCDEEAVVDAEGCCEACRGKLRCAPQLPHLPHVDEMGAALVYDGTVRPSIHRLKYKNARYVVDFFAAQMHIPMMWDADCLVPVPLHPKRQAERGYNQSALLAQALSARCGILLEMELLSRVRDTETQTGKNEAERVKNMRGAFRAKNCAGRRVVLIDDVCTTGSTLAACAEALKKAGAQAVFALCACVVLK